MSGGLSRRAVVAGSAAAVLAAGMPCASAATAPPAGPGAYGSGSLGDWSGLARLVSGPSTIAEVLRKDGLFCFGDSIEVATFHDLAERLAVATGDVIAVNAWSGRPTDQAVDVLTDWLDVYGLPRRILMAVGSNDVYNPTVMSDEVNTVMRLAGPDRVVFWVDVHVSRWAQSWYVQVNDQRNSGWINAQIQAATRFWPNLRVVPWSSFLASKPSRISTYLSDGVHTSTSGTAARNALIVQDIQAELAEHG